MTPDRRLSGVVSISRRNADAMLRGLGDALVSPARDCRRETGKRPDGWLRDRQAGMKARPWEGMRYLKPGFRYSDECLATAEWDARKLQVAACRDRGSPVWHGGTCKDGKRFSAPVACHRREHAKCRPSDCPERIRQYTWLTFMTLTDRRRSQSTRVRDWRIGAMAKRLERFFNLLKKVIGHFKYLWVRELHKSGFPHIHAVLSVGLPTNEVTFDLPKRDDYGIRLGVGPAGQKLVSALWKVCGGGYSVDWRVINGDPCYIAKYLDDETCLSEGVYALLAVNKIRDWSASKGVKAPRTDLEWCYYARGSKREASKASEASMETVLRELAHRRGQIRKKAADRSAKAG